MFLILLYVVLIIMWPSMVQVSWIFPLYFRSRAAKLKRWDMGYLLWVKTLFVVCFSHCSNAYNIMSNWTALWRHPAVLIDGQLIFDFNNCLCWRPGDWRQLFRIQAQPCEVNCIEYMPYHAPNVYGDCVWWIPLNYWLYAISSAPTYMWIVSVEIS